MWDFSHKKLSDDEQSLLNWLYVGEMFAIVLLLIIVF